MRFYKDSFCVLFTKSTFTKSAMECVNVGWKFFEDKHICVVSLCVKWIISYMVRTNRTSYRIVSVGSGRGLFEFMVMHWLRWSLRRTNIKFDLIAVEPADYPTFYKRPDYRFVREVRDKQCDILILNWCFPNASTYDYDAVQHLKPKSIFSLYGDGPAGGIKFREWAAQNQSRRVYHVSKMRPYDDPEMGRIYEMISRIKKSGVGRDMVESLILEKIRTGMPDVEIAEFLRTAFTALNRLEPDAAIMISFWIV